METLIKQLQHGEQFWQTKMCFTTIKDGGTLEREASVTLQRTDDTVQIQDKVKQQYFTHTIMKMLTKNYHQEL